MKESIFTALKFPVNYYIGITLHTILYNVALSKYNINVITFAISNRKLILMRRRYIRMCRNVLANKFKSVILNKIESTNSSFNL